MGAVRDRQWRIADEVAWTANDGVVVALDLRSLSAHPMTLEQSAAYIWEEVVENGPLTEGELVKNVADAYEVEEDSIRDDIRLLLDQLSAARFITG